MAQDKTLIVIVGPTAIGKTALAIHLAHYFNTEIISADSRQFFKEMTIGTAKPSPIELAAAPHHFINSHSIQDFFSTGDFEYEALSIIDHIFRDKDIAILAGGSGLYVNAVCNGLDNLPDTDLLIREKLNVQFAEHGLPFLRKELEIADPEYFHKVDQSNPQRMIRGLEFFLSTGEKLSTYLTNTRKKRPFNVLKIGLNTNRSTLYEQINSRVDKMMEDGLLDEVKALNAHQGLNALNTVGYTELFRFLNGDISLLEAIEQIKQNTRRFAKRQLTWFRKDENTSWFEPNQVDQIISYIQEKITRPAL
ncbi:tRNA (adenosine(37)-N6)-dimethylallyltransferase MiaA [Pedobacter sp. PWIIR3]